MLTGECYVQYTAIGPAAQEAEGMDFTAGPWYNGPEKTGSGGAMKRGKIRRLTRWLLPVLVLAAAGWTAWGLWRSAHDPVARTWQVQLPGLTEPVRAAVLSDLHESLSAADRRALAALTARADPDVILLLGDMLNADSPDASGAVTMVASLAPIAPVYYAPGNQELDYAASGTSPLWEELAAAGAVVLEQSYVDLDLGGGLRLGGLYDYAFASDDFNTCDPDHMDPAVYGFLEDFQATARCKVLLCHRPDSFVFGAAADTWDVDLVISGHLHGGQVVLPVLGGVYGGDQGWFPTYVHGVYEKGNVTLAVTSGLGTQGGRVPRFRNPPELMVLDLVPET